MDLTATYTFNAPLERVWALLMDTTAIGDCLPGARGLQPLGGDRYEVELNVAVSAVSGNFKGKVAIEDKAPPHSYKLIVQGEGRPGFVKGQALVTLSAEGDGTRVNIAAQSTVGGVIARVGQRLLDGVARTMMDRFFACMAARLGQAGAPD
jgi:uncharacterized protein